MPLSNSIYYKIKAILRVLIFAFALIMLAALFMYHLVTLNISICPNSTDSKRTPNTVIQDPIVRFTVRNLISMTMNRSLAVGWLGYCLRL